MDMLGFGDSDKPVLDYSIELWRDVVADFIAEVAGKGAVLVGNSIGSLVSLAVASKAGPTQVLAVACLNCAGEADQTWMCSQTFHIVFSTFSKSVPHMYHADSIVTKLCEA
jgi:pimeloyl-ACP methyl ester carboxylesterase